MRRLAVRAAVFALIASVPGAALAQDGQRSMAGVIPGYEPSALEQGLETFPARMAAFAAEAQAVARDESLSEAERNLRIAALWAEVAPDAAAFSASAADLGAQTAGTILQSMNLTAVVENALAAADIRAAVAQALADAGLGGADRVHP